MNNYLRKMIEVNFLRLAKYILTGRNVQRSAVISRRDNNDLSYAGEKIDSVIVNILCEYKNQ
tara:strand:- start:20 stop:205 length:186 start_codon:yes stop_codon:yes gene_type:complete